MKKTLLSLAITTAYSSTLFAFQPDKLQTSEKDVEHIIITGSRVLESIDEVPASVTLINQAQIQEQLTVSPEIQNLLAAFVPGIAAETGSSSNSGQTLRGRSPLVMIDGVPQSTPLRNGALGIRTLDPSAIERIEVIKGATSIYGNGAAGGIINYITKKASTNDALAADISLSTRFSTTKFDDSVGIRLNTRIHGQTEKLAYVFTATVEKNGVQRDAEGDVLGLQYGLSDAEVNNYFTKLSYEFDNDKVLQFTYNFYQSQQDSDLVDVVGNINSGEKTYAIEDPENRPKFGEPQGPKGNKNFMLKYVDDALTDNTQLTIDAYKQHINNVFFYSTNLANPEEGYDGGQSIIKSDKQGLRTTFNTVVDLQNIEATFIYGLDFLNDITSQPLVDGRIWVPEMDMDNIAGFLQTKLIVEQDWIIKAGVRQENIDLTINDYATLRLCRSAEQCSVPVNVEGGTLTYDATTYNLGLRYNAYEHFSPFISYSEGADISDIGRLLRTATVTDITDIRTEASIIKSTEIGFTSQFDDIRFEFSAYRSTSELGTTNKFDEETGIYLPVRAPQKIWGYEALLVYPISEAIDFTASYSWVEGKDTETNTYLGLKQISAPKATANIRWAPTDNASLALSMLSVGDRDKFKPDTNGNYVGDQGPIKNYTVFNLSGKVDFSSWTAFFGIENLFNRDYYPAKSQGYTYGGYNIKGLGTTANLGINYRF